MRAIAVVCLLILASCAERPAPAGTDTIGPGYAVGGGEWSSGGGITAVANVVERDGRAAVCGVWMTDQQSALSSNYNEDVIYTGAVYAGPTHLISNLAFMPRLAWRERLTGQAANCVLTGVPWSNDLGARRVHLRFPRLTFGDRSGIGRTSIGPFSGSTTTFREGPRPDPTR